MPKFRSAFIGPRQLSRVLTTFIFVIFICPIWFIFHNVNSKPIEIKPYKTLKTTSLEKFELYKRNLEDTPHLLISKNSEINFVFDCDSLTVSICDNEFLELGNKVVVDHTKIVTIKNYKYIQLLQVKDLNHHNDIDFFVDNEQLGLNYQNRNKGIALTIFIILIGAFASILLICYLSIEEKIITKLSNVYK